jgi:hypothetical protein
MLLRSFCFFSLNLIIIAIAAGALCGEQQGPSDNIRVSGQVTVDGEKARQPVKLLVLSMEENTDRLYPDRRMLVTDAEGRYSIVLPGMRGDRITVLADNPFSPVGEGAVMLAGRNTCLVGDKLEVDLPVGLIRVEGKRLRIAVEDQHGRRGAELALSCNVWRRAGKDGVLEEEHKVITDANGEVVMQCMPDDDRDRRLSCRWVGPGRKTLVDGSKFISAKDIRALLGGDLRLPVKRKDLALLVSLQWDPALGAGPPEPSQDPFRRVSLGVKGLADSEREAMEEGQIWFFELPPGGQELEIGARGRGRYRITRGTERVTVPERDKWPIQHVVTLEPAGRVTVQYVFTDSRTGRALTGVKVGGTLRSDEQGRVQLQTAPGEVVCASLDRYFPVDLKVPEREEPVPTAVSLRPFPTFRGRMTEAGSGKPVCFGEIDLRGAGRGLITGGSGRFCGAYLPDEYQVVVSRRYWGGEAEAEAEWRERPVVEVGSFTLKIGDDDVEKDIEVPALTALTVKLELTAGAQGRKPLGVALLRPAVGEMAYKGKEDGGSWRIYAARGKYRVVVAASEVLGFLSDEIDLERPEESAAVKVTGWRAMKLGPRQKIHFECVSQRAYWRSIVVWDRGEEETASDVGMQRTWAVAAAGHGDGVAGIGRSASEE